MDRVVASVLYDMGMRMIVEITRFAVTNVLSVVAIQNDALTIRPQAMVQANSFDGYAFERRMPCVSLGHLHACAV